MASFPAASPGAGNGTSRVVQPCTTSCANTCQDVINLLTEQITNCTRTTPVDKLTKICTKLCKTVWESDVPADTNEIVFRKQPSQDVSQDEGKGDVGSGREHSLDEFQIVKAVVLGLVTFIILLSICKMVFQLFVRYSAKADDRGH
ncbi:uncharacterized protein LOC113201874 [Frankliniella occidentalis]|uniref:Uncharacterized protein LOC113201874 n=1 Tax=Frankliniella occidentalis TaxID=133901 RepID=A0A6J1RYG2_FRAOC|nr:uncharacterized protein LOC113201874 [Frankliniella occidentalis]